MPHYTIALTVLMLSGGTYHSGGLHGGGYGSDRAVLWPPAGQIWDVGADVVSWAKAGRGYCRVDKRRGWRCRYMWKSRSRGSVSCSPDGGCWSWPCDLGSRERGGGHVYRLLTDCNRCCRNRLKTNWLFEGIGLLNPKPHSVLPNGQHMTIAKLGNVHLQILLH